MQTETPTRRLAEVILGEPLDIFVAARRPKAWRIVARDLYNATDGQIDVTPQTLANWFPDELVVEASA